MPVLMLQLVEPRQRHHCLSKSQSAVVHLTGAVSLVAILIARASGREQKPGVLLLTTNPVQVYRQSMYYFVVLVHSCALPLV